MNDANRGTYRRVVPCLIFLLQFFSVQIGLQSVAHGQEQCLAVTEKPVQKSTETKEGMKGKCPIRECFGANNCSCYDKRFSVSVTNNCTAEVRIKVSAGGSSSTGDYTLGKATQRTFSCLYAVDDCNGVSVAMVERGADGNRSKPRTDLASRLSGAQAKASKSESQVKQYRDEMQRDETAVKNKRDQELEAAKADVAARKKADQENRARVARSIPKEETIIPSTYPKFPSNFAGKLASIMEYHSKCSEQDGKVICQRRNAWFMDVRFASMCYDVSDSNYIGRIGEDDRLRRADRILPEYQNQYKRVDVICIPRYVENY